LIPAAPLALYRQDTGEKLLIPGELAQALQQEMLARQQAEERAEQAQSQVEQLKAKLRELGVDPDANANACAERNRVKAL